MTYTYNNKGTCSVRTIVELNDDHTIKSVQVMGGCDGNLKGIACLLYTSPSPRDRQKSRMPSSA